MDSGTSENKESAEGNIGTERTANQGARKHPAGRQQKPRAPEPVTADLIKLLLDHYFPDFNELLSGLPDPRLPVRITYSKKHLFYLGLCMFLFHCGSRSQLESERRTVAFFRNLLFLSGTDEERVASVDAMNYLMTLMNPANGTELLAGKMTGRLIRSRVLDKSRSSNSECMIAMDGVCLFTRKGEHPNSTHKKHSGEISSYYYALEAKLVTEDGMGLSLATEFIETGEEFNKEDCELNAFYRLAPLLKERFPKLRICLLLDGLYPNKYVLDICEKNKYGYYITLKDGCLPLLNEAARIQIKRNPQQSIDHYPEKGVFQHISWAVNLNHEGRRTFVLKCQETKITGDVTERNTFAWVTDVRPDKHNAAKLVREARRRWVVEEAFNIQKNGGYELTHNFGTIGFAMKNYYYLLQIAHILHQLMVRSDLFPKLQAKFIMREFGCDQEGMKTLLACIAATTLEHFRTAKNFVKRLAESFRNQVFSEMATVPGAIGNIQIRLNTS